MTRTMWIALFCLMGLGPAIAIRVVTRPASPAIPAMQHTSGAATGLAPNEAAKSDRLPLPNLRAEAEDSPALSAAVETPPAEPDAAVTIKADRIGTNSDHGRRWQDAHASIPPSEPRHRREMARKPVVNSAGNTSPKPRTETWHCRQDAMGSVLRSLNLSPRCNL